MLLIKNYFVLSSLIITTFISSNAIANSSENSPEIWEEPSILIPTPEEGSYYLHSSPIFDSKDNIWVFNIHTLSNKKQYLQYIKWDNSIKSWLPLETVPLASKAISELRITIDKDDNIFIVYSEELRFSNKLNVIYYDHIKGWQETEILFDNSTEWINKRITSDKNGNVILVFDEISQDNMKPSIWLAVFNSSTKQWNEPKQIFYPEDKSHYSVGLTLLTDTEKKNIYFVIWNFV
jgi:hypothetical protein